MRLTGNFGYGIADQDHPIIVFDPATHCRRYANASCHAGNDTGGHALIAKDRVEGCAWREATKAFLDDQMLAFPGLQFVDYLGAPRSLHAMRAVAVCRLESY